MNALISTTVALSTKPDAVPSYNLRLLPVTVERSALLHQYELEEAYGLERAQTAYEEERHRVEDEWKKGRDRVRERLVEGIEERRRRAREDKEGEGTSAGLFPFLINFLLFRLERDYRCYLGFSGQTPYHSQVA